MSTTETTINLSDVRDALFNCGSGADEVRTMRYSGRGMYGDECLGIVGDDSVLDEFMVEFAQIDPDAAKRMAQNSRRDSMGLSTVVYFPGVPFEGETDDDRDED